MIARLPLLLGLAGVTLLGGCGGGDVVVTNSAAPVVVATPAAVTTDSPIDNHVANEAAPADGELSGYVGKYPYDKVNGAAFLDNAKVKAAVEATITDRAAHDFIFKSQGPESPIVQKDGRIIAWGCEAHNCGPHNWAVAITPDGADAQVCIFEDAGGPNSPPATWYLPGGKTEQRPGSCPSE